MTPVGPLPRLLLGPSAVAAVGGELVGLRVARPLLISDRGLERAGIVAAVMAAMPATTAQHLDVPENPTVGGADAAFDVYRAHDCDSVVALGGGSVIDTAKFVAALASATAPGAQALLGRPDLIGPAVAPLIAIPTTVGTGSESSPVSALHTVPGGPVIGTRSPALVPRIAICDAALARTLPRRLIAATGIDALAHCVEGFLAAPANPIIDALALDGVARVARDLLPALAPAGDAARGSLMAAAFAGGAAIHKGLGPAHAVAIACADQDLHHGTLIAIALPATTALVVPHVPEQAARLAAALGADGPERIGAVLRHLIGAAGLPTTLKAAGYVVRDPAALVEAMVGSPFNRTSAYAPSAAEYGVLLESIAG